MGKKRSSVITIFERYQKAKNKTGKEKRADVLKENFIISVKTMEPEDMEIYEALKVYGDDFLKFVAEEISEEKAWEIKRAFSP
jgi:hypothetical protein